MEQRVLDNVKLELDGIEIPNVQAMVATVNRMGNVAVQVTVPPHPLWLRYDVQTTLKGAVAHIYIYENNDWYLMFEGQLIGFNPIVDAAGNWRVQLVFNGFHELLRRVTMATLSFTANLWQVSAFGQTSETTPSIDPLTNEFLLKGAARNIGSFWRRMLGWRRGLKLHKNIVASQNKYAIAIPEELKPEDIERLVVQITTAVTRAAAAAAAGDGGPSMKGKAGLLRWLFGRLQALNIVEKTYTHNNPLATALFNMERTMEFFTNSTQNFAPLTTFYDIMMQYLGAGFYDLQYQLFPPKGKNGHPVFYMIVPHPLVSPPPATNVIHYSDEFNMIPIESLIGDEATRVVIFKTPSITMLTGGGYTTTEATNTMMVREYNVVPMVPIDAIAKSNAEQLDPEKGGITPAKWAEGILVEEVMGGPVVVAANSNPLLVYVMESFANEVYNAASQTAIARNLENLPEGLRELAGEQAEGSQLEPSQRLVYQTEEKKIKSIGAQFAYYLFFQQRYGRNATRITVPASMRFLLPFPMLVIAPEKQAYYGTPQQLTLSLDYSGQYTMTIDLVEVRHKYAPVPTSVLGTLPADMVVPQKAAMLYDRFGTTTADQYLKANGVDLKVPTNSRASHNMHQYFAGVADNADLYSIQKPERNYFTMSEYHAYVEEHMRYAYYPLRQALLKVIATAINQMTGL